MAAHLFLESLWDGRALQDLGLWNPKTASAFPAINLRGWWRWWPSVLLLARLLPEFSEISSEQKLPSQLWRFQQQLDGFWSFSDKMLEWCVKNSFEVRIFSLNLSYLSSLCLGGFLAVSLLELMEFCCLFISARSHRRRFVEVFSASSRSF